MVDEMLAAQYDHEWDEICANLASLPRPIPMIAPTAILSGDNRGI
ncbi:hypothetical protein [Microbacterium sp. K24]|nr:hypothetical protein [Microbacterium sp. K24]